MKCRLAASCKFLVYVKARPRSTVYLVNLYRLAHLVVKSPNRPCEGDLLAFRQVNDLALIARAQLGIPLRIRTGISSFVDSCLDPLDERDSGKDGGIRTRDLQIESLAA
jgi:hypothetical protein